MRKLKFTPRFFWVSFLVILVFLSVAELMLRKVWGFCDSVLLMENKNYEYIPQPNQHRFRFRNHVDYNSFSMRSEEPDTSAFIILGFGDSVINGSVMVDQDSVATSLLSRILTATLGRKIQVLNISAGSWGPDNCYEYLKEKGDFNAKMIFLVASSHDAFDNINFQKVVDREKGFESKQYSVALWELLDRYLIPRITNPSLKNEKPIQKNGTVFNSGFGNLDSFSRANNLPFFIYLHPDSIENRLGEFNSNGKEIMRYCEEHNIRLIHNLGTNRRSDYRDVIHLTESGHRRMAGVLEREIVAELRQREKKTTASPQLKNHSADDISGQ